jgi:hypothetical protein
VSVYHRLSAAAKEAEARDRLREPAIACPHCEAKTTVDDLLGHVEQRCPGQRPPHPRSRWVKSAEACDIVSPAALRKWVREGRVLTRGRGARRLYLLRDLVRSAAMRRRPKRKPGSLDSEAAKVIQE